MVIKKNTDLIQLKIYSMVVKSAKPQILRNNIWFKGTNNQQNKNKRFYWCLKQFIECK